MIKEFILVISMWGQTATGNWEYIGNQYVYNIPMTQNECKEKISGKNWSTHLHNGYYRIQFDCMHINEQRK